MTTLDQVVEYLRNIQVFKGQPQKKLFRNELVCVDQKGEWEEYFMQYPYWQFRDINVHEPVFNSIHGSLQTTDLEDVLENALNIPDSKDSTIIEFGSSYGNFGMGYIASKKPNARVILLDKLFDDMDEPNFLFNTDIHRIKGSRYILVFHNGRHLLKKSRGRDRLQSLYHVNGLTNVELHEIELDIDNIHMFFNGLNVNGNVYLFGNKAPGRLGFLIGKAYNHLNARFMSISLTSQEKIKPVHFPWKIIQKNLRLTDHEIQGYIQSVYDEKVVDTFDLSDKYDYSKPEDRRIGIMLKLGMAFALAKEVDGKVLRNKKENNNYNQIDHYVQAKR